MTRRLRLASMGLGAFMLPACIGTTESTERTYSSVAPGYVVMNRPGTPAGTTRRHLVNGPSAPAALDPTAMPTDDSAVALDRSAAPIKPALPTEGLDIPMPPAVMPVRHEQPAVVELPLADSLQAQGKMVPVLRPALPADEPLRVPAWPVPMPIGGESRPVNLPDPAPQPDPVAPAIIPPAQGALLIPQTTPAPEVSKALDSNVSFKVPEATPSAVTAPEATSSSASDTLLLAIKAFQTNRPQEALEHLKHLDSTNQEMLMYLMPLMVRLSEGKTQSLPPEELAMLVDRLQTASGMLKGKASLRADRVCFCRGVRKFADLDPYEPGHEFRAGDMVFLYAELKNFTCEPAPTGPLQGYNAPTRGCNVRLTTTLELRDAKNNLIWRTDLNKNDYSLTPPQDYYHTYRFCVPEKLPAGTYTLWLNVVDKPTGRAVRKPVEMRVGQS